MKQGEYLSSSTHDAAADGTSLMGIFQVCDKVGRSCRRNSALSIIIIIIISISSSSSSSSGGGSSSSSILSIYFRYTCHHIYIQKHLH